MCAGGSWLSLKLRKQITNRVKVSEKAERVSKRATVMQARKPSVDLAALESEERRVCSALSGNGEEARRHVWRVVGIERPTLMKHLNSFVSLTLHMQGKDETRRTNSKHNIRWPRGPE